MLNERTRPSARSVKVTCVRKDENGTPHGHAPCSGPVLLPSFCLLLILLLMNSCFLPRTQKQFTKNTTTSKLFQYFHQFSLRLTNTLINAQTNPIFTHSSSPFSTLRSPILNLHSHHSKHPSSVSETTIGQGKEMIQKFKLMLVLLLKIKKSQGRG